MSSKQSITNEDVLLADGLVEYHDPIADCMRQVNIETAKRIAVSDGVMEAKLIKLGVIQDKKDAS